MDIKPQIVVQDIGGIHNSDLNAAHARIFRGGSWKQQRIIVIVPAAATIPAKVYLSHTNLIYPPNNGVYRYLALGIEVGEAYSTAINEIINHPQLKDWEYILTLEHDNSPPHDGVMKLLEQMEAHPEYAAIGGLYFTKGYGGVPQIWGERADPMINFRPQPPDLNGGLVECYGTGMGFTMFRTAMFKDSKLRRPWFVTQTKEGVGTQDLYFWSDAQKFGYRCAIDCSIRVGHYDLEGKFGPPDTMW
jgi:hypothetical protein